MNTLPEPGRIVVGIDSSEHAAHAAIWAAALAAELGSSLHLAHVMRLDGAASLFANLSYGEYQNAVTHDAQILLKGIHDRLAAEHPGLEVTTGLSCGDPVVSLIAASSDAELLVVGTRGHGGFAGLLLGSVGLRLAARSERPVALVPGTATDQSDPAGEIVLGVEAGQGEQAAAFAFETAARLGARVQAVNVWESIPPFNGYYFIDPSLCLAEAELELEHALKAAKEQYPQVAATAQAVNGTAAGTLVELARGKRLLVVGAHRRHGPLSAGVGSVLHPLLAHTPCPLVIVPAA
jgi:nucleotide-binding universal stress UspA family protein